MAKYLPPSGQASSPTKCCHLVHGGRAGSLPWEGSSASPWPPHQKGGAIVQEVICLCMCHVGGCCLPHVGGQQASPVRPP